MTKHRFVTALVMVAVSASTAWAGQKPIAANTGERVVVTQSGSREELQGRLLDLSPTSLAILVDGRRVDVPIENVLRIDVRNDSLKDGAILGGAILGGLGVVSCAGFAQSASQCVTAITVNTGFGVLLGAGIDALHKGRTPIYIKAGASEKSVGITLRF